jgi:DNA-binding SARP family transcriptional activator/WD40 repeat protein
MQRPDPNILVGHTTPESRFPQMSLDYRVLGPVEVWADGRQLDIGGARQRRLLGALVLADGRPVSAERLIDIVWVGEPPDRARNTLRTYIARARRALEINGEAPLMTDPTGWRLERPDDSLDSNRFESLLAASRAMSADPTAALASIEEALSLWRDHAFVEFRDEDWCAGEAVRLDELRLAAQEERFEAMLGCGLYDDAVGDLEAFIGNHPLRDRPRGQHMVALYRAGRQVEAVRVFQDYRRYLEHEVGVEPSDELRILEQRIVQRDPALQQLAPGGRALRGYQLGQQIGTGAFGRIYRATQPMLGREVAIKVVRPELADDPEFIRRFDGEAQLVARLEHPHIVPLFDYWREPGGAYLVMRYLKGGNAQQLVASRGALSVERVARLVDEIGGALATAHAVGVVHRDVKPANILFDEQGSSYLGDFGIATGAGAPPTTEIGSSASPVYASPEQVVHGSVSPGADVYAFGAVLFELLSGQAPFPLETPLPDLLERKRRGTLPSLARIRPDVPAALDEVIRRSTAPDPARRFAAIGDMILAFRAATAHDDEPIRAPLGLIARNPYKGLAAFDEADAADYFGRERLVEQLEDHLSGSRFLAVVGPSGSGKSSAVRAGLAPRLRAKGAYITAMIPGAHPMRELVRALLRVAAEENVAATRGALQDPDRGLVEGANHCLPDPSAELMLIVDQFEELFTLSDGVERDEFLGAIAAAATVAGSRVRVIATIRADFYDRPLGHATVGELVQANTVAVTPLGPADLERAVSRPAARVGVTIETALAAALVADYARASASLPLVQFALTHMFENRDSDTLTLADYQSLGGLAGAVSRRADEIYDGFDETVRDDVRRLFGRLVVPGERADDTRQRIRVSELATIAPDVIATYGDARLLTLDRDPATREPTVELAHEALIREWPRLRRWVENDRDGLRTLRHLSASAAEWEAAGHDPGELYRGARLVGAEEWAAAHPAELNPVEEGFLEASLQARDAESAQERRRVRRLRGLLVSLAILAAVAVVAGLVAVRQREAARDNADEAERRALENRTAQLTSDARLAIETADPDLAILLALAAYDVSTGISDTPPPGVVAALHETVQASRLERIIPAGREQIAVHPDGRHVAMDGSSSRRLLSVYDLETGEFGPELTLDDAIGGLAYSPDGSLLAVSFASSSDADRSPDLPAMLLLDSDTLEIVHELEGGRATFLPSWSADGRSVLAMGRVDVDIGDTRIWDVDDPAVARAVTGTGAFVQFVPGTNTIAILEAGTLDIVDRDTGEVRESFASPDSAPFMAMGPDGRTVAFSDFTGDRVEVVDLGSDEPRLVVEYPRNPRDVRFSPDGSLLSISGNSDVVMVVDLDSGESVELRGHGTGSSEHTFSPSGDRLLAATLDGATRVWNLSPAGPDSLGNLDVGGRVVGGGRTAGESKLLVPVTTGSNVAQVVRFDIATGARDPITDFWFESFRWPVFAADGSLVAGFSPEDRVAAVVDVESGETMLELRTCEAPQALDADRRWVLVEIDCPDQAHDPGESGTRRGYVDLDTGELISSVDEPDDIFGAEPGPPGTIADGLFVYRTRNHVVFVDSSTREPITEWNVPGDIAILDQWFSPDGSKLGISAQTRQGVVFDVEAIMAGAPADEAVKVFEEMSSGPVATLIPVGDHLVTTHEAQVRQWDPESGELLVDVSANPAGFPLQFAMPDNSTVLYADEGGLLRRFRTDVDDLVELARARVNRSFSEGECSLFFPGEDCPID